MKRLAYRRAADVQPLGHLGLAQMFAGSESTGPNGLPHGPVCKIAEGFSPPLTRSFGAAAEMQAALVAARGRTAFRFDFPFRFRALSWRGLADWRFHRTMAASRSSFVVPMAPRCARRARCRNRARCS